MTAKHLGECPFCKGAIKAKVIEENVVRRDKCECPECGEAIYVCRTPGCDGYAKGGALYDHELCPVCTRGCVAAAATVVVATAVTLASALAVAAIESSSGAGGPE